MIVLTRSAVDAIGSSVCGSPIIARLAAPPFAGAASAESAVTAIAAAAAKPMAARPARKIEVMGQERVLRMPVRNMALPPWRNGNPRQCYVDGALPNRVCVIKLHPAA